jgi:hypothetical protein
MLNHAVWQTLIGGSQELTASITRVIIKPGTEKCDRSDKAEPWPDQLKEGRKTRWWGRRDFSKVIAQTWRCI